ncbi:uncharacterized protein GGS25DRAFT_519080 [Hypoxylon fragiforme]|uniref:uncharacterized protein n=1 Tax=Hypoxylon fragiforme TaxID=63214 RepID=UPI0020C66E53|nr:uncharacterized protein GGS25DRAFT_519080 [Hypoxylon fragiforme]KAI2610783.1 hypothetical protein GGS25DRAFT_519080 [Hypoxylon fragiforme]
MVHCIVFGTILDYSGAMSAVCDIRLKSSDSSTDTTVQSSWQWDVKRVTLEIKAHIMRTLMLGVGPHLDTAHELQAGIPIHMPMYDVPCINSQMVNVYHRLPLCGNACFKSNRDGS